MGTAACGLRTCGLSVWAEGVSLRRAMHKWGPVDFVGGLRGGSAKGA